MSSTSHSLSISDPEQGLSHKAGTMDILQGSKCAATNFALDLRLSLSLSLLCSLLLSVAPSLRNPLCPSRPLPFSLSLSILKFSGFFSFLLSLCLSLPLPRSVETWTQELRSLQGSRRSQHMSSRASNADRATVQAFGRNLATMIDDAAHYEARTSGSGKCPNVIRSPPLTLALPLSNKSSLRWF